MTKFTETIIVKVTPEQKKYITKMANNNGQTVSELVRMLCYLQMIKEDKK